VAEKRTIALCLEYPLALRGGVSVLVETLLRGLKGRYDLVLVSPDTPESLRGSIAADTIKRHIRWEPGAVSRETSERLAEELSKAGVVLAHFHLGGTYGWGMRMPQTCPIPYADHLGVRSCSTVHLVVGPLDGYCAVQRPWWFKLALWPMAWTGKLLVLRHLRREIAVSQHDFLKLRRRYWPLSGRYVQIYHSRIEATANPAAGSAREPTILNVGHVAWRKGQLVLAEAFAKVAPRFPDWNLVLAGEILETAIAGQIRKIAQAGGPGERINLAGERADAMELMRRAAIYVQPSYFEALGLALQEAMFTGCASVGTRAGGIPELIEHDRTGLLVAPGDSTEMAQALEKLMSDAALRAKFGAAAAQSIVARGMTAEAMVARHVELYESILAGS
jgi:glycosyltransferase involved in cell wall biosynthesis